MSINVTCPTCCRAANNPFRVYDDRGRVDIGCVDRFHSDHLIPLTESARWHNRKEAEQTRRSLEKFLGQR